MCATRSLRDEGEGTDRWGQRREKEKREEKRFGERTWAGTKKGGGPREGEVGPLAQKSLLFPLTKMIAGQGKK